MAITVFDAVGKFTADTTQLDQFTLKLEQGLTGASEKAAAATVALKAAQDEFKASIAAVTVEGGNTTDNMQRLAEAEQQLALAAAAARQEHNALKNSLVETSAAADQATYSIHKAQGEAMLLGEEIGIRLPRHVTRFLAEIPGVGQALSLAFEATAILFLIQALAEAAEKLSNFISEEFIFTEAMKASDASIAQVNKSLIDQAAAYDKAKAALEIFGLSTTEVTKKNLDELSASLDKNRIAAAQAMAAMQQLRIFGIEAPAGSIDEAQKKFLLLSETIRSQAEQLKEIQKQYQSELAADNAKATETRIAAEKVADDSLVGLHLQMWRAFLGADHDNYANELKIQAQANAEKYDNEKKALNDRLELALSQGEKGRTQAVTIESQLTALENKHRADELKAWNDFQKELYLITSQPIPLVNELPPGMETISNEVTKAFDQAKAAAQALGITLRSDLDSSLSDAFQHYDKLTQLLKQGVVTQKDVDNAYIALIRQEIDFAKATGAATKEVQKLEKELALLTGQDGAHLDAFGKKAHLTFENFRADLKSGVDGIKELEAFGQQAFDQLTAGLETSIAAALSGSESFGQALEKVTGQVLTSLAAQALVKALFYTAEGFAAMAGFAETSAGEYFTAAGIMAGVGAAAGIAGSAISSAAGSGKSAGSSSSGTPGPSASSPNVNAGSGPSQVVNVTHFADGGIATKPMLAMVAEGGRASEEAIIPLHDQNALDKIAAAFMEPIQRLARSNPNLSIPSSVFSSGSHSSVGSVSSSRDMRELGMAISANIKLPDVHLYGSLPALVTEINHGTKTGRIRLHSTSTDKTIKKA